MIIIWNYDKSGTITVKNSKGNVWIKSALLKLFSVCMAQSISTTSLKGFDPLLSAVALS